MLKTILAFAVLTAVGIPSCAYTQDVKQQYEGASGCSSDFRRGPGTYGIRLDKTRRAYLKAYTVHERNLLLIVQYSDDKDQCGVVRDVIQPKDASAIFVWDCTDVRTPHQVVVGTWPAHYPSFYGPAIAAWRVNLRELQFVPLPGSVAVQCTGGPGAGADAGEDLVDLAKRRPAKPQ
jgi:hypothetical protein